MVLLCSKLSPLIQGGQEKFLIQSCVSFDQHCNVLGNIGKIGEIMLKYLNDTHGNLYYGDIHLAVIMMSPIFSISPVH